MTDLAELKGFPVAIRLPVQWGDLDAYGHVNNVVYLKWFEAVRAVYAQRVGVDVLPKQQGVGAVLATLQCKYHRQLGFPGEVIVGVKIDRMTIGNVSLTCHIVDSGTRVPIAEASCECVLYDYSADRPVPIPDRVRAAVEELEGRTY